LDLRTTISFIYPIRKGNLFMDRIRKPSPSSHLMPNAATIKAMKKALRGGLKSFATVEDLMADLNADD